MLNSHALKGEPSSPEHRSDRRFLEWFHELRSRLLFGKHPLITIPFQFSIVLKLLSMIVILFIGVPAAAAICFRLLLPLFTVDMPRRHVEPDPFV
jgi:hypothetical protein